MHAKLAWRCCALLCPQASLRMMCSVACPGCSQDDMCGCIPVNLLKVMWSVACQGCSEDDVCFCIPVNLLRMMCSLLPKLVPGGCSLLHSKLLPVSIMFYSSWPQSDVFSLLQAGFMKMFCCIPVALLRVVCSVACHAGAQDDVFCCMPVVLLRVMCSVACPGRPQDDVFCCSSRLWLSS